MPELRISGIEAESIVDGPGLRFVVFTQGCPHRCKGCHNPETHDMDGGRAVHTREVLNQFGQNPLLSGITFSGGEPFLQADSLTTIAREVRKGGKTVMVYTGYTLEQLLARNDTAARELLSLTDTLVDGPYIEELRDLELSFRGSANQRVLDREAITRALGSQQ